jgi:hypothetical protein
MQPVPPVAWPPPPRRGVNPWLIVSIVLGAVVVLPVILIASVTLLGSNAQQKFDNVGTHISTNGSSTNDSYDPSLDTNGDGELTVDDIPEHSVQDCARWDSDDSMDADTYNLCVATAY